MEIKESAQPDQLGERLPRIVRIGMLLEIYGELLTEKQRIFSGLHYNDDMSFGEIAKDFTVSRQAVHDAVKHAEQTLERFEGELHVVERYQNLAKSQYSKTGKVIADIMERLISLKSQVQQNDGSGSDSIVDEIDQLIELIRG